MAGEKGEGERRAGPDKGIWCLWARGAQRQEEAGDTHRDRDKQTEERHRESKVIEQSSF